LKKSKLNLDYLTDLTPVYKAKPVVEKKPKKKWRPKYKPKLPDPPLPVVIEFRRIPFSRAVATIEGDIWSLGHGKWRKLKTHVNKDGYLSVKWKMRKECPQELRRIFPQNLPVHRLVLYAWAGLPEPGQECRHGLGGKLDNSPGNLRWGTAKENQWDNIERGIYKLRPEDVRTIREQRGKKTGDELAKEFGVSRETIYSVYAGNTWSIVV